MSEQAMQWTRLLSRARLGRREERRDSDARSAFQRDFDRIVFSSAFRRLQDKTQVFPLARNDYVRTRLTHSLEVSSVGRSLGTLVGEVVIQRHRLQDVVAADFGTIVAAACLAHDIGNPPFGHAGEDAIRLWFRDTSRGQAALAPLTPAERQDFLRFEGNAQGFRLLTRLQSPDNPGGMQLTCAVLGTFSKYPRAGWSEQPLPDAVAYRKFGFFQEDADSFHQLAAELGLPAMADAAWLRHPLAYLVEAADDICFRIIDIEDGFRLGLLDYQEVLERLLPLAGGKRVEARLATLSRPKERVEYLRARAISLMVEEVQQCFLEHEPALLEGVLAQELLDLIPSAAALAGLRQLAEEQVYVAQPVVQVGAGGFEVLGALLAAFVEAVEDLACHGRALSPRSRMLVHLMPEQFIGPNRVPQDQPYRRLLRITDFVSGMTDSYAVGLFKQITGISLAR
ncbi:MAG TPA: deoxyguanosinetriphosphate triphosphohydrolase [Candidatus Competibacteraceae bacterium]|nr:deoxyguanosinetriphosphate triphosphohydrolase [Candidatus Competibacteraceae bacterium]